VLDPVLETNVTMLDYDDHQIWQWMSVFNGCHINGPNLYAGGGHDECKTKASFSWIYPFSVEQNTTFKNQLIYYNLLRKLFVATLPGSIYLNHEVFVMKKIVTFFLALLVSGCDPILPSKSSFAVQPERERLGDPSSLQKALVIGNRDYSYSPLRNPINDAEDMADKLENMGFDVTLAKNLNRDAMNTAVQDFTKLLSETPYEVAFFYFSGHGAQMAGQNFMIPVDNYALKDENDLEQHAVPAQNILAMMENVNKGVNILILDACRDNPYEGSEKSLTRGLSRIKSPRGALIAFATAPGQTASDGDDANGVFTGALLEVLENAEHRRIEDVFIEVQNLVIEQTDGMQEPWYNSSLRGPFCFGGCK
jgi:hypothetical protein